MSGAVGCHTLTHEIYWASC
ncbi:hypothetical protein LINPERPRIM_LOCUS14947 [Linum perenne]